MNSRPKPFLTASRATWREPPPGGAIPTPQLGSISTGCPMAESASEIGRQGRAVSASFTDAFEEMAAVLEGSLEDAIPASERRRLAIAAVAAEIGAIAVSRAIAKTDTTLADEVLQAV